MTAHAEQHVAGRRPVDLLVKRILDDPRERCTDRDLAFRLVVLRRWVARAGGADIEFTSDRGGQSLGWMLTRRGHQVLGEILAEQAA